MFAGGWTLEAAEVVCADERIAPRDILDLLAQLVSKSLVQADESGDDAKRYRLLETVRQYARERLVAAGEAESVHGRHAAYFLEFGEQFEAERWGPHGDGAPMAEQIYQLEREHDNLRGALRWWIDLHDVERAINQAAALSCVWYWRGYLTEGQAWLQEILNLPATQGNPASRPLALRMLTHLACRHADYAVALEALTELLAAELSAGDRQGVAWARIELGNVNFMSAAYADAWAFLEKGLAEASDLGDKGLESRYYQYSSMLALCEGRYELARTLATEASRAFDQHKRILPFTYSQMTFATADLEEGRYDESHARFLHTLEIALDFGDRTLLAHLLEGFSGLATARGQHHRAVRLGGAAAALRETAGAPLGPAWQHIPDRWLAISREALGEVAAAAAWSAGRNLPVERALEEAEDSTEAPTIDLTS